MDDALLATTTAGVIRGRIEDGITVFRGVPYAAPPMGRRRWLPAQPAEGWSGIRDCGTDGQVCPQPIGGMEAECLGYRLSAEQLGEDCLTATIWTPRADGCRRPVLVWIHGGGFFTGAATLPIYSGASLAARGDIVVVGLNYRVGPLGFLDCNPRDTSHGNRGLTDQLMALQWVAENIAQFGGDPDNITLAGQSAGAWTTMLLLAMPEAPKVRRAIVQSLPAGVPFRSAEAEAEFVSQYREYLNVPNIEALMALPAEALLKPFPELMQSLQTFGVFLPPWLPNIDGGFLKHQDWDAVADRIPDIDIMIGWTSREMALFFGADDSLDLASEDMLVERMARRLGSHARDALQQYRTILGTDSVRELLIGYTSDEGVCIDSLRLADRLASHGRKIHAYEFGVNGDGVSTTYGGAHVLELPFIMGTFEKVRDAGSPLVSGISDTQAASVTAAMQKAWIHFIRSGNPATGPTQGWKPYGPENRAGILIGEDGKLITESGDIHAVRRNLWDDLETR